MIGNHDEYDFMLSLTLYRIHQYLKRTTNKAVSLEGWASAVSVSSSLISQSTSIAREELHLFNRIEGEKDTTDQYNRSSAEKVYRNTKSELNKLKLKDNQKEAVQRILDDFAIILNDTKHEVEKKQQRKEVQQEFEKNLAGLYNGYILRIRESGNKEVLEIAMLISDDGTSSYKTKDKQVDGKINTIDQHRIAWATFGYSEELNHYRGQFITYPDYNNLNKDAAWIYFGLSTEKNTPVSGLIKLKRTDYWKKDETEKKYAEIHRIAMKSVNMSNAREFSELLDIQPDLLDFFFGNIAGIRYESVNLYKDMGLIPYFELNNIKKFAGTYYSYRQSSSNPKKIHVIPLRIYSDGRVKCKRFSTKDWYYRGRANKIGEHLIIQIFGLVEHNRFEPNFFYLKYILKNRIAYSEINYLFGLSCFETVDKELRTGDDVLVSVPLENKTPFQELYSKTITSIDECTNETDRDIYSYILSRNPLGVYKIDYKPNEFPVQK